MGRCAPLLVPFDPRSWNHGRGRAGHWGQAAAGRRAAQPRPAARRRRARVLPRRARRDARRDRKGRRCRDRHALPALPHPRGAHRGGVPQRARQAVRRRARPAAHDAARRGAAYLDGPLHRLHGHQTRHGRRVARGYRVRREPLRDQPHPAHRRDRITASGRRRGGRRPLRHAPGGRAREPVRRVPRRRRAGQARAGRPPARPADGRAALRCRELRRRR